MINDTRNGNTELQSMIAPILDEQNLL